MRRSIALLLTLSLHACSVTVSVTPPSPSDAESPVTPPTPPASSLAACGVARAHGAVLAWSEGAELAAIDARGELRRFHRFDEAPGLNVERFTVSPDGFVAVVATRRAPPGQHARYALIGPDGATRWSAAQETTLGGTPFRSSPRIVQIEALRGGATLARHITFDRATRTTTEWRAVDGTPRLLEGASVVAGPDAHGRVVVREEGADPPTLRAWDPRLGTLTPWGSPSGSMPFTVGGFFVELAQDPTGVALVRHDGAQATRLPLPFVATTSELRVLSSNEAGWVLFARREENEAVYRLDLRSGRLDTLALRLPAGVRTGNVWGVQVDEDGALFGVWRDEDWARLYRSEDGARWTTLGRPTRGTLGVQLYAQSGTYILRAHNELYGGQEWGDAPRAEPDGIEGSSLQLIRPSEGRIVAMRPGDGEDSFSFGEDPAVSPNGRCVAWVTATPEHVLVHVANLADGSRIRVARAPNTPAGHPQWL